MALASIGASTVVPSEWVPLCLGIVMMALVSATVESIVVAPIAVRNFRVEIDPSGLIIHRGALFRSVEHIPWRKVTVVRRQTGPLLRRLELSRCVVFTPAKEVTLLPMSESDVDLIITECVACSA